MIVGHGLRERTVEGPLTPNEAPVLTGIFARRYSCKACRAILVVVPRGVGRCCRYALGAIAWALSLWAYEHASASAVRSRTSTAKAIGAASATRWASLKRWTRSALALFGYPPRDVGTVRERAAQVAVFVASKAPLSQGPVPLDAFAGAGFCAL